MKKIEMEKQAKAFGFAAMKFMETKDLEFEHEFRQFCEMNDCGNYGNNYAFNEVMKKIHNGAIILMHSVSKDNMMDLDKIIKKIKSEGYSFKSLYEL